MSCDCIIWTGATTGKGYPATKRGNLTVYVKRALWQAHRGPIPQGMTVRSRCGNRLCVNVEHLYLDRPGRLGARMLNGRFARKDPETAELPSVSIDRDGAKS